MRMNLVIACLGTMTFGLPAVAADNPNCKAVHIGDLGWTDIALTNASAEVILTALGYETSQTLLGLDVTFLSLKTGDLDVFQGNWRPVQDDQYKSYFEDGSVEVIGPRTSRRAFHRRERKGKRSAPPLPRHSARDDRQGGDPA